jgi:lipopolysaccharide transport system permease protein
MIRTEDNPAQVSLVTVPAGPDTCSGGAPDLEPEVPETIIEPRPGWRMVDFRELWRGRELLYFLVWRDVKVRYKQAVLGAAWAVLQPLATMAVFTLLFSRLNRGAASSVPYPLFVFSGLLPWIFFSHAIGASGQSVLSGQHLITKIYFPRLLIPLGAVGAGLVDFAISFVLLAMLQLGFWASGHSVLPNAGVLLLPVLVLGLIAASLGVGTLLAALAVAYRDFRHVTPFLIQLWMFATPSIFMRAETLDPRLQWVLPLNPAYGLIANFRAATLGQPLDLYALAVSAVVSVVLLVVGCLYFRRVERSFADLL